MPHLIVSSIGTSLITNVMPPERPRRAFFDISNHREGDLTAPDRATGRTGEDGGSRWARLP